MIASNKSTKTIFFKVKSLKIFKICVKTLFEKIHAAQEIMLLLIKWVFNSFLIRNLKILVIEQVIDWSIIFYQKFIIFYEGI